MNKLIVSAILSGSLLTTSSAWAVIIGQVDNFEDGTTQNWLVGLLGAPHPAPPLNIPSGGPAGADDNYLLLTSVGGAGAGSRLSVLNFGAQWAGDYLASGVNTIQMYVNNLGNSDLALRLLISDPTVGPPANVALSTQPILLGAGSGWTQVSFPIAPGDMTAAVGDAQLALKNATELRLFHSPAAVAPGPAVVASLGVDDITARAGTAAAVPETSTSAMLLGLGLAALTVARIPRRRPSSN